MCDDAWLTPSGFGKGHDVAHAEALMEHARAASRTHLWQATEMAPTIRPTLSPTSDGSGGISFAFTAFGARVGVSLGDSSLLDLLVDALPPGSKATAARDLDHRIRLEPAGSLRAVEHERRYHLFTNDVLTREAIHRFRVPDAVESVLEGLVAECARPWLFLHAGVVAWRGRAIVLPADTFAGKSTLIAALVAAGATYFSDEYAVLDANGLVYPYPRRLSLRVGVDGWHHQRIELGSTVGGAIGTVAMPTGLVALISYRPDRAGQIEEIQNAAAIMSLCQHTVAIRQRPADALAFLGNVAKSARVIRGYRGEAEEAAGWLLEECAKAN